ncbi:C-type lectin domain family 4 member M-like [Mytilus trossulus]|uniref:C-type lectin domain family 4 member M-like n=1 Tax=Mytilus trossulus TaxID=6551 RepID=UPI00300509DE
MYDICKLVREKLTAVDERGLPQLSTDVRWHIIGMQEAGMSFRQIARRVGYHHSTISRILIKHQNTNSVNDLPRSGSPSVTSDSENRAPSRGALDCELGWEIRRGRCYRRIGSSSHTNGAQLCNDVNAVLITPKTAEENSTAVELLQLWGLQRMWIGLSNTNENNEYKWDDGTRLIDTGYTSWRPGEPNGGDEPMCVEAHMTGWNDNPCHRSFPVVCQQVEGISDIV